MENTILNISIDLIMPNRFQPRLVFDEKALNELADSIKEHGIIEPIIVRPLNDKYEIIAGERRYKAACIAGLTKLPVIVKHLSDYKSAQVAVIENVQRRNLNPMEEAKSYKRILDHGIKTQEELAKEIGVSQSTIANKLRLLSLAEPVKQALSENKISERHARALLKITSLDKQVELLNKVITERLTVKDLDDEIKKLAKEYKAKCLDVNYKAPNALRCLTTDDDIENLSGYLFDEKISEEPVASSKPEFVTPVVESKEEQPITEPKIETIPKEETIKVNTDPEIKKIQEIDEQQLPTTPQPDNSTNIFDIPTIGKESKPDYPSLEDLQTNMDLGIKSDILVPEQPEEPIVEEKEEPKLEVTEPIVVPETPVEPPKPRIIPNDLNSVKQAISDLNKEIREAGFNIEFEDYDFSDLYQAIIKINK